MRVSGLLSCVPASATKWRCACEKAELSGVSSFFAMTGNERQHMVGKNSTVSVGRDDDALDSGVMSHHLMDVWTSWVLVASP